MLTDLRQAFRMLTKSPGLSAVIILSLALGVGVNTAVFSWLRDAIFRPLPGVGAEVVCIEARNEAGVYVGSSWLEYRDLLDRLPSFKGILAHRPRAFSLGDNDRGERVWGEFVSGKFFSLLGVSAERGRFFRPDEADRPGSAPVAVISHRFWQQYFKGAPDVVGRTFKLNNHTFTVIGVAAPDFIGAFNGLRLEVWLPLTMAADLLPATRELTARDSRSYVLLGVPKPGVSRAQLEGEIGAAAAALAHEHPAENAGVHFELLPVWLNPRGGAIISGALGTLQLFAGLILVVVCVNTANLLLARASVRRREIGIRLACGAGAGRILRQLLTESVVISLVGAALGSVFALWGVDLLGRAPVPTNLPVHLAVALDWHGLAFAAGLGVACGLLFGLAPALQLARGDVQNALRGGRGTVHGRSRLRDALVGAEVAVALVVLVLAGLFLKSFHNTQTIDPGFNADRVLIASVDLVSRGYTRPQMRDYVREVTHRLAAIPGTESVAAANMALIDVRGTWTQAVTIDGQPQPLGKAPEVVTFVATPRYFETMGIKLVAGADLAPLDQKNRAPDAVINEEMARRFWPGISPLGHRFRLDTTDYEVVGVARNAKYGSLAEQLQPAVWITARTATLLTPTFHVRVLSGDPMALSGAVRATLRSLDPEITPYDVGTFSEHISGNLFQQRMPAVMLSVLAPLALGLAAIGLYAVLAYSLAQRTQEIGVRLTLGATPASVVALIAREGMKVVLAGAVVGWLLAFALGRLFSHSLVNVSAGDPLVYAGVPTLLLLVAGLACWLPARRAASVNPIDALRAE